ncbi:MAG: hypothetical protein ACKVWR_11560 [Acidimicrobiales bacterium]
MRFLTRYDYRPRWGRLGGLVDRWLFRPVFGWATAWSFDRLRLQGLVPKLWKVDEGEVAIWQGLGMPRGW